MLLSTILRAHDDAALPGNERVISELNIGDAFLYRHHQLYRRFRDAYWELGYRFDTNDFCFLFEVPLFALDGMLRERRVPVRDTVSPLRDLVRRFPGAEFEDLSFSTELGYPINHILHHSVHCVADHVTHERIGSHGRTQLDVLRILVCEAFGNAVDLLANVDANAIGEEGRSLFIMNNLVVKSPEECAPYEELIARVGWKVAMQVVALFFLFRNLLAESIDREFLGDAFARFGVACEATPDLIALFDRTTLGFGFLVNTNTRYFRYLGFEFDDLLSLYDFDLLEMAKTHPGIAQTWDAMGDLIVVEAQPRSAAFQAAVTPASSRHAGKMQA